MKRLIKQLFVVLVVASLLGACTSQTSNLEIKQNTCNNKEFATGVNDNLSFSWKIESKHRNQKQTAYQILVSDDEQLLNSNTGNVWNSGKVSSDQSINVLVDSLKLNAGQYYFWKVKVWSNSGFESNWSKPAKFITALDYAEWSSAQWIGMETMEADKVMVPGMSPWGHKTKGIATRRPIVPYLRTEFAADKKVKSALLFVSGLGHYKAYINGEKISTDFMTPGWTNYHKICLYNTYDVTKEIEEGDNAIGLIVGTGFYNINNERYRKLLITYGMPKAIAKLIITYTDGSVSTVSTNDSWKTSPSPVTYSSIYGGENYDARLEQKGWSTAAFDDSGWENAILAKHPGGQLFPDINYPVKRLKEFNPVETYEKGLDTFAFDFGQNASAVVEIQLSGKKGDTVRIYPSELLYEELKENQRWTGWPHYYEYVLKGEGVETWSPMFTYYGMRYAHVIGAQPKSHHNVPEIAEIVSIKMHHISNSAPKMGSFWCSNPLFNQIDTLIRYGIKSNMQSVLTDCPHRERLGWIEQTYLMGNSIKFNYEVYHIYHKLVRDMIGNQRENGLIVNFAPEYVFFGGAFTDSPEWGSAIVQVPWLVYKTYGDISLIKKAWESMQKYMEYLDSKATDNVLAYGLGDWYDLGPELPGFSQLSPLETTASSIYYLNYRVMAKMAIILGENDKSKEFANKAQEIKEAYNKKLFDAEQAIYATGSQSAMAIPLSMGMVKDEYYEKVFSNLVDSINANDKRLTAGDIGFHYLIDALTEGNNSQLVYDMNNRDDVPGYGYQIKKGATALAESWEALDRKSNNHLMLGHIEEWFYNGLGGIRQEESSIGYKNIVIKPAFVDGLKEVKTTYESPYGTISSSWKNTENELLMNISIPVNTTAVVYIPTNENAVIREGGSLITESADIEILESIATVKKVKVGSGSYKFKVIKE